MRWLSINWTPPPMTYDILSGYNVWYWGDPFSNWTKLSVGNEKTTLNLTDLGGFDFCLQWFGDILCKTDWSGTRFTLENDQRFILVLQYKWPHSPHSTTTRFYENVCPRHLSVAIPYQTINFAICHFHVSRINDNVSFADPGSSYKFRVQNAFRFGVGKSSQMIECRTKTEGKHLQIHVLSDDPLFLQLRRSSFCVNFFYYLTSGGDFWV